MTRTNSVKATDTLIEDVISALKAQGCNIQKIIPIKKSVTARARKTYKIICNDSEKYILSVSNSGIQNFYLQRSIRNCEEFSRIFPGFHYALPAYKGKVNGVLYVVYEYLDNTGFICDDYPVQAMSSFYARSAITVKVNASVVEKILESLLSAWPEEYRHAIQRLDEFAEYEDCLHREVTLMLAMEHGDYTTNNILKTKKNIYLIDFEFCRPNQPVYFDVYDYLLSLNKNEEMLKRIPNYNLHVSKFRLVNKANEIVDRLNKSVTVFTNFQHPKLCENWNFLYKKKGAMYNLSRDWCRIWVENFIPNGAEVNIFTVWEHDKLMVVLPLYRLGKILKPIGTGPDLYDGFSALYEQSEQCSYFIKYLCQERLIFMGRYLDSKDAFISELISRCYRSGIGVDSEVVDTRPISNLETLCISTRDKSDIKRLKNKILNRFGEYPELDIMVDKDTKELHKFIDMHIRRWQGGPFKKNTQLKKFLNDIVSKNFIILSRLRIKDVCIAYHLGYSNGNKSIISWMPAYDPDFSDYSPGKILLYELLIEFENLGYKEFDFGRGAESYKYLYKTDESILLNITAYPASSFLGRTGFLVRRIFNKLQSILWAR